MCKTQTEYMSFRRVFWQHKVERPDMLTKEAAERFSKVSKRTIYKCNPRAKSCQQHRLQSVVYDLIICKTCFVGGHGDVNEFLLKACVMPKLFFTPKNSKADLLLVTCL